MEKTAQWQAAIPAGIAYAGPYLAGAAAFGLGALGANQASDWIRKGGLNPVWDSFKNFGNNISVKPVPKISPYTTYPSNNKIGTITPVNWTNPSIRDATNVNIPTAFNVKKSEEAKEKKVKKSSSDVIKENEAAYNSGYKQGSRPKNIQEPKDVLKYDAEWTAPRSGFTNKFRNFKDNFRKENMIDIFKKNTSLLSLPAAALAGYGVVKFGKSLFSSSDAKPITNNILSDKEAFLVNNRKKNILVRTDTTGTEVKRPRYSSDTLGFQNFFGSDTVNPGARGLNDTLLLPKWDGTKDTFYLSR